MIRTATAPAGSAWEARGRRAGGGAAARAGGTGRWRASASGLGVAVALAGALALTARAGAATTRVSYLAGGSVYVEAGRLEGLGEGDSLLVVREGRTIAWLRAAFLSSHRAACDTLRTFAAVQVGDTVRFSAREAPPVAPVPAAAAVVPAPDTSRTAGAPAPPIAPATPRRASPSGRLHGRVGVGLLSLDTQGGGRLSQPALDLTLDGSPLAGSPLTVSFDLRGRWTSFQRAAGGTVTEDLTRVYRFSLSAHDPSGRYLVTVGRQSSPSLSPVSLFDGALVESRGARWNTGLFSGAQPDPLRLGLSSSIVEGGGYLEWHQPAGSARRWSLAGGAVSSVQAGTTNRDFAFAQLFYLDPRLSVFGAQELDLNRGWKRALGEPTLSATSTFMTASLKLTPSLWLNGGYDNRRNVRLYRDRVTPETEFDDRYREGAWGGLSLELAPRVRLSGDARTSAIANGDRLNGWSGAAEVHQLGPLNGALRGRLSHASGAGIETGLASFGGGLDPLPGARLELAGGVRTTRDPLAGVQDRTLWESGNLDLTLVRRAYLDLSVERDHGGITPSTLLYSRVSWRF